MAGVAKLCKDISAKCPYCNRALDLTDFGQEVFRRMLVELSKGERVEAEGFGTFRAPVAAARTVKGLKANVKLTSEKRIIRFRASVFAKEAVNILFKKIRRKK